MVCQECIRYFFAYFFYTRQEDSQHNRQYLTGQDQSKVPRCLGDYTTSLQIIHMSRIIIELGYIPPYLPLLVIDPLPAIYTALLLVFRDLSPSELYQSNNKIIVIIYGHIDCVQETAYRRRR